jgi:hypothetical protein
MKMYQKIAVVAISLVALVLAAVAHSGEKVYFSSPYQRNR